MALKRKRKRKSGLAFVVLKMGWGYGSIYRSEMGMKNKNLYSRCAQVYASSIVVRGIIVYFTSICPSFQ